LLKVSPALVGNQFFNVFCINDTKLGSQLKESLLKTLHCAGSSTKENSGGNSTPSEEQSVINKEHVNKIIDFCISPEDDLTPSALKRDLATDTKLAKLIDERLLAFKEKLRKELLLEVEAEMDNKLRDKVKEEVTSFLKTLAYKTPSQGST
jgi:hypothetical protein